MSIENKYTTWWSLFIAGRLKLTDACEKNPTTIIIIIIQHVIYYNNNNNNSNSCLFDTCRRRHPFEVTSNAKTCFADSAENRRQKKLTIAFFCRKPVLRHIKTKPHHWLIKHSQTDHGHTTLEFNQSNLIDCVPADEMLLGLLE